MKLFIDQLDHLITVFKPRCEDTETLVELQELLHHEKEWIRAHYLSTRIRAKSINAFKSGNVKAEVQYSFEEVCAKTMHNLTAPKKTFEPDTAYWIIPLALKLARVLEIDPKKILDIVTS